MKKYLLSSLALVSTVALAAAPLIWNSSDFALFLTQKGFKLNDGKQMLILSVDPTASSGIAAPIGSIGVRDSSGTGQLWLKTGSSATSWTNTAGSSTMSIGGSVTSGTTGSIPFIGSGPVLSQDNANLFWDASNKRVGIGMAVPKNALHVGASTIGSSLASAYATLTSSYEGALIQQSAKSPLLALMGPGSPGMLFITHNGTSASPTTAASGDSGSQLTQASWTGSDTISGASISFPITSTVTSTHVPTDVVLSTDSGSAFGERMRIKAAGTINVAGLNAAGLVHTNSSGDFSTSTLVNADVSSSAAIAVNKLAALSTGRAVVTDGSGFITQATTTATEIGFVNGVTSAIQTQLNTKGTVSSVAFTVPGTSIFGVSGSPVTGSGSIGLTTTGTSGGIPYFSSSSALSTSAALTANAITLGGGAGVAPSSLGSLGSTTTVLHGNAAGAPTFGAVALSADVSGQLPLANGGTAANLTAVQGGVVYSGASAMAISAAGLSGQFLTSNGTSAPTYTSGFAAPTIQVLKTGSAATYAKDYTFVITSGSATVGATYTNNAVTFTVYATVSSATRVVMSGSGAPAASGTLTKSGGTGDSTLTFSQFFAPLYLKVRMVGGGGGGAGAGVAASTAQNGGNGTDTTFGTSLLTANGASGAAGGANAAGAGGSFTVSSPAVDIGSAIGGYGQGGNFQNLTTVDTTGGNGGSTPFGGSGGAGFNTAGLTATANTGSGGGGGGNGAALNSYSGGGGGAAGYVEALITSPSATYAYTVGGGGGGGTTGTSGNQGGAGAAGKIIVEEYYQ